MGILQKMHLHFKTKKALLARIEYLQELVDYDIKKAAETIKEFKQNKVYYIETKTPDEARLLEETLTQVKKNIPWSLPEIICINREVRETTKT